MHTFGNASPYADATRTTGARLLLQVPTVAAAEAAARLAPDAIIAQGTEAGGHGGGRSLFPLLPAVVDRVAPIPVVAAGGISDGRGIAAAFALGAAGVLIGTRFYAAEESLGLAPAKQRIVEGSGDATIRTRVFDVVRRLPWPPEFTGRALRNDFVSRWHGSDAGLTASLDEETSRYTRAVEAGDFDTAAVWAGEGIDLVRDVAPAATIMARLLAETHDALGRIALTHASAAGGTG
jgi:nitronate monooxygenase